MVDAYSGAETKVIGNLKYVVNTIPYDASFPHPGLWDEAQKRDVGANSDDRYAPFAIDLANQKDENTARQMAKTFLLKDPDGSSASSANQNRYGALYFTNLPPVSSQADADALPTYLTYFSMELFGRKALLAETPGAGDYKKTW
jgi:hypothetical protein